MISVDPYFPPADPPIRPGGFRHGHGERLLTQWTKLQGVSGDRQLRGVEAGGARGLAAAVPTLRGGWSSGRSLVERVGWKGWWKKSKGGIEDRNSASEEGSKPS